MKETTHIIKDIASTIGAGESSKIYVITSIATGETEVVVEKTISKRMSIKKYHEALAMYERLGDSGYIVSIEDIIKLRKR